ncbi:hypothetical protein DXG01_008931 [Tephrocybe rancida]|nr:hypothetical protein DXG01_008931 [Tephrocybe rancida]
MSRVLVTGVNGFVGSNVVLELIKAGYQVRGTLRAGKIDGFKEAIGDKFPALEVVEVNDIATADLSDIAIEGYVNVLREAVKAGISRAVITGSWASTVDPTLKQAFEGHVSVEKDWSGATEEEFLSGAYADNPMWTYLAAKALGERAAWKYAAEVPSLDLSVILPPFIFGPYAPGFPLPAQSALSSNQHIYTLLTGAVPPPLPPLFCDVRDVARAHVAALNVPKAGDNVEDKRFLICGGTLIWKDAVEYLHAARPDLKDRIPALDANFTAFPSNSTVDASRAKGALGMDDYLDWKETMEAAADSLLEAEKSWSKAV